MHDRQFMVADRQIHLLLDTMHEAYQIRTAALCNMLQAFAQVEGAHDTEALIKFARRFAVGRRLLIDMGLLVKEDGFCSESPSHSSATTTLDSDPSMCIAKRLRASASCVHHSRDGIRFQNKESGDEKADGEHVAKSLEMDELKSSPVPRGGLSSLINSLGGWPGASSSSRAEGIPRYNLWDLERQRPPSRGYRFSSAQEPRGTFPGRR